MSEGGTEDPREQTAGGSVGDAVLELVPSDLADDVLAAVASLGGEARRRDIIDRALELGGWSAEQRAVRSWYSGAARTYHLRTLADYAVDVQRRRGLLEAGAVGGRWRLTGADGTIVPRPLGAVFTAAVGVAGEPVDDDWRADTYALEHGHIWFSESSNQLSAGDHLFAIGVSRDRAVLGLFEVLSTGDLRQPRNPWDPDRWPYATAVRALAGVPPIQARSVDGVRTPRATAYRVQADEQRLALYDVMRGHEYATTRPAGEAMGAVALVERARALRRVRPFDPDALPTRRRRDDAALGSDEAVDLDEKTQRAHHELLARLHAGLRDRGWSELGEIPLAIDLQGRTPRGEPVIFEAKTLSGDNETRQCRAGLAQLLEYRQDYGAPEHELCLVVDQSLSPRRADLLDRLGIAAISAQVGAELCGENAAGVRLLAPPG